MSKYFLIIIKNVFFLLVDLHPWIHAYDLNIYHDSNCHGTVIAIKGIALLELNECHAVPKVGCEWRVECSNGNDILLSRVLSVRDAVIINSWKK